MSVLAFAAPGTAAAAPGNGKNCVGSAVSQTAHQIRQAFGEGFGAFFQSAGVNPGQLIQAFEAANCDA
jgi:hypothetical protein